MNWMTFKRKINKKFIFHLLTVFGVALILTFFSLLIFSLDIRYFAENILFTVIALIASFLLLLADSLFLRMGNQTNYRKQLIINFSVICFTTLFSVALIRNINIYVVPIAITSILISVLTDKKQGIFSTVVVSMMIFLHAAMVYGIDESAMVGISVLIGMLTGLFTVFAIRENSSRFKLVWVSFLIALAMFPLAVLAGAFAERGAGPIFMAGLWSLVGNILAVILATACLPLLESGFRVWTNYKLAEYCSFEQPLLRELAEKAPGTFNHSLIVGNLAESCALAIGENSYMARCAAYYHDIGKLRQPEFFIENQDGYNPHDDLIPEVSVNMIKSHTKYGPEILAKYRLPDEIVNITREHHGTSPVMFFYLKAQIITEGVLNKKEYSYDGPKPSSKIAAIIMISDTVEAATRAVNPNDRDELRQMIAGIIEERILSGQFDECPITMKDLEIIKETILKVIPAIYHKRIKYDLNEEEEEEA